MMPAPSATPPTPPSPALHRTQFIRGVRDSMAKALAQGMGDTPAETASPPSSPPPPPAQPQQQPKQKQPVRTNASRISLTGRLKQLIGVGGNSGGGDPVIVEPLPRTPPRAASMTAESPLRSPARVLNLPDQLLRSPGRVLSSVDQQLSRQPAPPPPPPPATSLKPIVRLPESSAAESAGAEAAANGDTSEERKRMIALAQLKILQRKPPTPQKLVAQESISAGGTQDGSPLKTYGRRAELVAAAAAANGATETLPPPPPRKNVKLMPPLTLLVPPLKSPVAPPPELLMPDVEDASRCASGLLIRKTYYKAAAAGAQQPVTSERNGALPAPPPPPPPPPSAVLVRRPRGRPRRAAVVAAAAVAEAAAVTPLPPALSTSPATLAVPSAAALPPPAAPATLPAAMDVKPVVADPGLPETSRGRRVAAASRGAGPAAPAVSPVSASPAAADIPPVTITVVKRRHGSSGRSSDTSSGRSSAATSPRPKKRRRTDLKSLFLDEGAINILSEMEALNGEKRRTRVPSSEKLVYKSGATSARDGTSTSTPRRTITPVRGSLRALPPARGSSPLKKNGRTVNKIRARAIKMKKQADAKKAVKAATSAKLKASKVKIKEEPKSPSPRPSPKALAKVAEKPSSSTGAPKAANQKITFKVVTLTKAGKSASKNLSPGLTAKKLKAAAAAAAASQPKPKKQPSAAEKPELSSGKKSPPGVSSAEGPAPQEKTKQSQPKLAQDKNLNIIERKTAKEQKNGERKKSSSAEEKQQSASQAASRDKSASPSSKSSSKSSSPLPIPATSNDVPTSPSSLSYSSLQRRLEVATLKQVRRKEVPGDRERSSSRSNRGTVRHREICVKKFDRFHQVILCPVTTRLKAGLNVQVMRELREYLSACERDPACRAVLLTSSAGPFCQGLDYTSLLGLSPEKRRKAAEDLARELKEFVRAVAGFSKPLMAGVLGSCVGLGVSLLPLCDLVYVTEKAALQMPYARLGTVPEGGATHSLTALLGHAKAGAMVMTGRAMTGTEAVSANLATGLVWSASAYEELIALARQMLDNAAQLQALESTKALLRHSLRAKLEQALHSECRLLVHQWSAPEFQQRVRQLYDEGALLLQKPGFDTQ